MLDARREGGMGIMDGTEGRPEPPAAISTPTTGETGVVQPTQTAAQEYRERLLSWTRRRPAVLSVCQYQHQRRYMSKISIDPRKCGESSPKNLIPL